MHEAGQVIADQQPYLVPGRLEYVPTSRAAVAATAPLTTGLRLEEAISLLASELPEEWNP